MLHAVIAQRLAFLPMIGGGLIARHDARTPQVSPNLTVYTFLCMQSYAPSCDWFTPSAMHLLSTFPQKLISINRPIKGISDINRNLKTFLKVIMGVKKLFY